MKCPRCGAETDISDITDADIENTRHVKLLRELGGGTFNGQL